MEDEYLKELEQARQKIHSLMCNDPLEAINFARSLNSSDYNYAQLKAMVFIDSGSDTSDTDCIKKGIDLIEIWLKKKANQPMSVKYNLANGLSSYAMKLAYDKHLYNLESAKYRLRAKSLFTEVITSGKEDSLLTSQALINRANILYNSYRWLEAYKGYSDALAYDTENGVASSGMLKILSKLHKSDKITDKSFNDIANELKESFYLCETTTKMICGEHSYPSLLKEVDSIKTLKPPANTEPTKELTKYEQFVYGQFLYLDPIIAKADFSIDNADKLKITSLFQTINDKSNSDVPAIFAMFNVIKSDYLTARWLAYCAFEGNMPKNGHYHDTLDYACYGARESMLLISQRVACGLLDKIAVAIAYHFGFKNFIKETFVTVWFDKLTNKKGNKTNKPDATKYNDLISENINNHNPALIALSELALDLSKYNIDNHCYLKVKKAIRNASTHRFTVMHDIMSDGYERINGIDHYDLETIESEVKDTLFLAKAAITYFVEAIMYHSHYLESQAGDGLIMPMFVQSHKYIRGRKT